MHDRWIYDTYSKEVNYQKNTSCSFTLGNLSERTFSQWVRFLKKQHWHLTSKLSQFENAYNFATTKNIRKADREINIDVS